MTADEVRQWRFVFESPIQIRYNDIDTNGHVNNGVYHSYYDMGRLGYFDKVFHGNPFGENRNIIIAQVNTTYLREVFKKDVVSVRSTIIRWGNSSFDMLQGLFRQTADGEELVSFNVTTFVSLLYKKPSPVPQEWKELVYAYESMYSTI